MRVLNDVIDTNGELLVVAAVSMILADRVAWEMGVVDLGLCDCCPHEEGRAVRKTGGGEGRLKMRVCDIGTGVRFLVELW